MDIFGTHGVILFLCSLVWYYSVFCPLFCFFYIFVLYRRYFRFVITRIVSVPLQSRLVVAKPHLLATTGFCLFWDILFICGSKMFISVMI